VVKCDLSLFGWKSDQDGLTTRWISQYAYRHMIHFPQKNIFILGFILLSFMLFCSKTEF